MANETEWTREDIEDLLKWLKDAGHHMANAKQALASKCGGHSSVAERYAGEIEYGAMRLEELLKKKLPE